MRMILFLILSMSVNIFYSRRNVGCRPGELMDYVPSNEVLNCRRPSNGFIDESDDIAQKLYPSAKRQMSFWTTMLSFLCNEKNIFITPSSEIVLAVRINVLRLTVLILFAHGYTVDTELIETVIFYWLRLLRNICFVAYRAFWTFIFTRVFSVLQHSTSRLRTSRRPNQRGPAQLLGVPYLHHDGSQSRL